MHEVFGTLCFAEFYGVAYRLVNIAGINERAFGYFNWRDGVSSVPDPAALSVELCAGVVGEVLGEQPPGVGPCRGGRGQGQRCRREQP